MTVPDRSLKSMGVMGLRAAGVHLAVDQSIQGCLSARKYQAGLNT